ncbi:uncharacterized protein FOMMEDRAFT_158408 [Fomitiporia mediterranea MF3/22]|uniref:uncharacterized protein n=1 Tax=Fomitiporia mediterranea (strain MF3/22) TaxID=694068 RepID=UPI00044082A5|nr:uncharacterized protein FOMMEDRAFT_158408 [Fomitiporia mediterranea MF3/22]EJD01276.1 hypothetical protein FOMMEDRAFT_158408 [Fomitiporia mediterranea MF3/22]
MEDEKSIGKHVRVLWKGRRSVIQLTYLKSRKETINDPMLLPVVEKCPHVTQLLAMGTIFNRINDTRITLPCSRCPPKHAVEGYNQKHMSSDLFEQPAINVLGAAKCGVMKGRETDSKPVGKETGGSTCADASPVDHQDVGGLSMGFSFIVGEDVVLSMAGE